MFFIWLTLFSFHSEWRDILEVRIVSLPLKILRQMLAWTSFCVACTSILVLDPLDFLDDLMRILNFNSLRSLKVDKASNEKFEFIPSAGRLHLTVDHFNRVGSGWSSFIEPIITLELLFLKLSFIRDLKKFYFWVIQSWYWPSSTII